MEGWSGSSGESNVNSSSTQGTGGGGYISPRFVDQEDDQLLDLCDDVEPHQCENRLLFDFTSDKDRFTPKSDDKSLARSGYGQSEVPVTVSVSTSDSESPCIVSTATDDKLYATSNNREVDYVKGVFPVTSKNEDIFSHGNPTIVSTVQSGNPNVNNNTTPASTYTPFNSIMTMPLDLMSRHSTTQERQTSVADGNFPPYYHDRGAGSRSLADEPPDVMLKQPLLQSHSRPRAAGDMHSNQTIRDPTASSSYSPEMVVDYTDDVSHLTHRPRGSQTGHSSVMLDSLPPAPPSSNAGARVTGAEGDSSYVADAAGEEVHCHSAISKHKMNDKLARRQLLTVLVLCVLFMIGETVGGVLANSLALFTDVLHLASDLISYGISLLALYLSGKQATRRMTFGYHRAEVLGALFSVFIIWLVSGVLCYIAVERIVNKHYMDVKPDEMLITASLGVVFNLVMGFVLHSEKCCGVAKTHNRFGHGHSHSHNSHDHSHGGTSYDYEPLDVASRPQGRGEGEEEGDPPEPPHHKNINVRAAFIHVVGDIIQSVGVLVAALIIKLKEDEQYRLADPICTFVFSLLVLCTTISVLRDAVRIIMEGVNFEQLKRELLSLDSVVTLHDLNIWALTMDRNALSVHLAVDNPERSSQVLRDASLMLKTHNFHHLTIQVEAYNGDTMPHCSQCQLPNN